MPKLFMPAGGDRVAAWMQLTTAQGARRQSGTTSAVGCRSRRPEAVRVRLCDHFPAGALWLDELTDPAVLCAPDPGGISSGLPESSPAVAGSAPRGWHQPRRSILTIVLCGAEELRARLCFGSVAVRRETLPPAVEKIVTVEAACSNSMIKQAQNGWAPLVPSTSIEKRRLGFPGQLNITDPLLRIAAMRRSIYQLAAKHTGTAASEKKIALFPDQATMRSGPQHIPACYFLTPGLRFTMSGAGRVFFRRMTYCLEMTDGID